MKIVDQLKGSPTMTIRLEPSDFPTNRMLKTIYANISSLPDGYAGTSTDLYLTKLFSARIEQYSLWRKQPYYEMDNPYDKIVSITKADASVYGWRVATQIKRFSNPSSFLDFSEPMRFIGKHFSGKTKTKRDEDLITSYFYLILYLSGKKYQFDQESFRSKSIGDLKFILYDLVAVYKETYKEFPSTFFLEKVSKEIEPLRNRKGIIFYPFKTSDGAETVMHLTAHYSAKELETLILDERISAQEIRALNSLGYIKAKDMVKNRKTIPAEWLEALAG